MGTLGERIDAYPSARFAVEVDKVMLAEFIEVSGLEAEVETFEYQEGGNNMFTYKLPGRIKFPNVTLKRGVTASNDLWDWFQEVMYKKSAASGQSERKNLSIERKNVSIVLYDQAFKESRRWNLMNAYPKYLAYCDFVLTNIGDYDETYFEVTPIDASGELNWEWEIKNTKGFFWKDFITNGVIDAGEAVLNITLTKLVGEELKTGESMPGRITIQMSQGAEQGHQYGFEVKIIYGHEEA